MWTLTTTKSVTTTGAYAATVPDAAAWSALFRGLASMSLKLGTIPAIGLHPTLSMRPIKPPTPSKPLGRPLRRSELSKKWRKLRTDLDLPDEARGWHSLRHTYASALIHAGLSVKTVQARLGHASAVETLEVYSHLWPDSEDDTRAAIDGWLSAPAAAAGRG